MNACVNAWRCWCLSTGGTSGSNTLCVRESYAAMPCAARSRNLTMYTQLLWRPLHSTNAAAVEAAAHTCADCALLQQVPASHAWLQHDLDARQIAAVIHLWCH